MLRGLTEAELVAKAKLILKLVEKDRIVIPLGLTFQSAWCLPHGGILYELNSTKSVLWFNTPAHRGNFVTNFGSNATVKDQTFNILVENIPISYNLSSIHTNTEIETKGGLMQGSITKARWIKPITR
ncbi:hypothetical protein EDD22DRAFT_773389 [Suillus occidentalis]|nr:hypothetical protein EDD22DRAFT_773389 [Suillus occidentalis]